MRRSHCHLERLLVSYSITTSNAEILRVRERLPVNRTFPFVCLDGPFILYKSPSPMASTSFRCKIFRDDAISN